MIQTEFLNEIIIKVHLSFREFFESGWQGVEVQTELVQL